MKLHSLALLVLATALRAQNPPAPAPPQPSSPPAVVQPASTVAANPPPAVSIDLTPEREFRNTSQVQLDLLMLSVPEAFALTLRPQLSDPTSVAQARAELLELVGRKQAQLIDWPSLSLHDGERAVSETITEERYPIEFESGVYSGACLPVDEKAKKSEKGPAEKTAGLVGATPSTFETRNTGSTLEAEVHVAPDLKAVTVHFVPQLVALNREKTFPITGAPPEAQPITQPIFKTNKVSTSVTLENEESRLIYFGKTPATGEVVIFILTARIHPAKAR